MCAPCKIIIDEGAAAVSIGESPVFAMARAAAREARSLPGWAQNSMSRIDLRYIPRRWEATSPELILELDRGWYEEVVAVLGRVIAADEKENPAP